jgi:hypothetical protein
MSSQESESDINNSRSEPSHTPLLAANGFCKCGCIPQNICGLFEMAEKRKEYQRKQRMLEEARRLTAEDTAKCSSTALEKEN